MKNLFVLLIFVFVVCFFFIPHGGAIQPTKAGFSIMEICQDNLIIRTMDQMSLINSTFNKDNLLCETTYAKTRTKMFVKIAPALAQGIIVYKATNPRSFHAGK